MDIACSRPRACSGLLSKSIFLKSLRGPGQFGHEFLHWTACYPWVRPSYECVFTEAMLCPSSICPSLCLPRLFCPTHWHVKVVNCRLPCLETIQRAISLPLAWSSGPFDLTRSLAVEQFMAFSYERQIRDGSLVHICALLSGSESQRSKGLVLAFEQSIAADGLEWFSHYIFFGTS
jgi:hypothetical protein